MSILDCLARSRNASCPRVIREIVVLGVAIEPRKADWDAPTSIFEEIPC